MRGVSVPAKRDVGQKWETPREINGCKVQLLCSEQCMEAVREDIWIPVAMSPDAL